MSRYFRGRIFRSHIWGRLNASDYVLVRILVVDNNQLIFASGHCIHTQIRSTFKLGKYKTAYP